MPHHPDTVSSESSGYSGPPLSLESKIRYGYANHTLNEPSSAEQLAFEQKLAPAPKASKIKLSPEEQLAFSQELEEELLKHNLPRPHTLRASIFISESGQRYVMSGSISAGSFGKFRLARTETGSWVAFKVLRMEERIKREAGGKKRSTRYTTEEALRSELQISREVAAFTTPIDFGRIDGKVYLAMRLMAGSLWDVVKHHGPVEPAVIRSVIQKIARDLQRCDEAGYVHRDIKPENILYDGKSNVAVADFGLAVPFHDGDVKNIAGTPWYMSPETLRSGSCTGASDIFSVGVTALFLLNPNVPFHNREATVGAQRQARDHFAAWYSQMLNDDGIFDLNRLSQEAHTSPWDKYMSQIVKQGDDHAKLATEIMRELLHPLAARRLSASQLVTACAARHETRDDKDVLSAFQTFAKNPEMDALFFVLNKFATERQHKR